MLPLEHGARHTSVRPTPHPLRGLYDLRDEQRWIMGAVLGNTPPPPEEVDARIVASSKMTPSDRIQIYRRMIRIRFEQTLEADFPVTAGALGDETFSELAESYAERYPSESFTLADFGARLGRYLEEGAAVSRTARWASDLVRLECLVKQAEERAPMTSLTARAVSIVPAEAWATAQLVAVPSLRLATFRHDVYTAWSQYCDDLAIEAPAAGETAVAVWAVDGVARVDRVSPGVFRILASLVEGASLADAIESSETEEDLQHLFATWIARGWFARIVWRIET